MSKLSIADKTYLESVFDMGGGYVLNFSNSTFSAFFGELGIDIYDEELYPGGGSKANRMRALWKSGSDAEVSLTLNALADYLDATKEAPYGSNGWASRITDGQVARIRKIAAGVGQATSGVGLTSAPSEILTPEVSVPAILTTEATVTKNKIQVEIHEDIYNHINQYLASGDHFHAVEESYKLVREKLRDITGKEKATDAFAAANYPKIFGHQPVSAPESDFFEGVKFLNMSIQFLRNEKAHTLATPMEANLALHYIALASLAYDLITRYVSEDMIREVEELVSAKRRSYRTAGAFYRHFENGKWLQGLNLPADLKSATVRKVLKEKWLKETDLTRSYDYSNVMFMRLELVADQLTKQDLDYLLDLPTKDANGNDQEAGMWPFLEYLQREHPNRLSKKVRDWIAKQNNS